ncbi:MAG: hypothetical protein F4W68_00140 [Cenarchaeum sp. SB0661_bin_35]|nr:hypothetical protein [Cenarchaeum sp. SB0667_bin_13]MXZ93457.1 hypothetical protein [Cenarchaeum sp. SB0666_bin_15]MYC78912.1 hypothetical protein [Cenarchaeum sp. SB0661_bin_35]MYD58435.1 hypothetical protein [Cenarchaeum sp. SB0678_bin_8]MYI52267.1 hypothetical protein [Cenarchaeum sp. SB0673_bin_9]MYJ28155.1 hypothetical protein [Cenarchaeum sp. SB0672_bin_9]
MRIGVSQGPLDDLAGIVKDISARYSSIMSSCVAMTEIPVMLGDATVTRQATFDLGPIEQMFAGMLGSLPRWSSDGVTTTNNEDIRRIFVKFHTMVGNYIISAHLSVQFHVLLYYRPVQRVIDCQMELSRIIDKTKSDETEFAKIANKAIAERLTSTYGELHPQELFEKLYQNDELRQYLEDEAGDVRGDGMRKLDEQKTSLFNELDSLLIETYQTTDTMIDDMRMVTGEEGYLCSFDVEYVKSGTRHSVPSKISPRIITQIRTELEDIHQALSLYI